MTPWKNSCRIKARKMLKEAGLDKEYRIGNDEGILSALEFGIVTCRRDGEYINMTKLYAALKRHDWKVEAINEHMAVIRGVHVSERAG